MTRDSWEKAHNWYDSLVGEKGHYYHQEVVLPGIARLLDTTPTSNILDVGCGQGILARNIPGNVRYTGIDASSSLIDAAKKYQYKSKPKFVTADATKPFPVLKEFTHATIVLALQNIENAKAVLQNINNVLLPNGKLIIVLNHPCFRIPKHTGWGFDMVKKVQYRRMDRYASAIKIPIQTHPGKAPEEPTFSYHHPISTYVNWLGETGFAVTKMEEWVSNKVSTGSKAKMENLSRSEFPLFLAIVAQKFDPLIR